MVAGIVGIQRGVQSVGAGVTDGSGGNTGGFLGIVGAVHFLVLVGKLGHLTVVVTQRIVNRSVTAHGFNVAVGDAVVEIGTNELPF